MEKSAQQQLWENLEFFAACCNEDPGLQSELQGTQGWIDLSIGMLSEDKAVTLAFIVKNGRARLQENIPDDVDATVIFTSEHVVLDYLKASSNVNMILSGLVRTEGNFISMGLFDYLLSCLEQAGDAGCVPTVGVAAAPNRDQDQACGALAASRDETRKRRQSRIKGERVDPGVKFLDDPCLAAYGLEDFPRIAAFREAFFSARPEISAEHGKLLTDFYLQNGYETQSDGTPWDPNLRTAKSFHYLMAHKTPVIRPNDLIAGSYTENPVFGAVGQPYAYGPFYWGELRTFQRRSMQPYRISEETIQTLHKHVFPFWSQRTITELWRQTFKKSLPREIHERFFAIFFWKSVSIAENPPRYEAVLQKGTLGLMEAIQAELEADPNADTEKINTLTAMRISLDAVNVYAANLAARARKEQEGQKDPVRRGELKRMAATLDHVPRYPARTMDEAIQALAIIHICVGLEITDDGPTFGRLDQILQPYFEKDMARLESAAEREAYIRHVIELLGCLYLKQASHEIPSPEIGIWLNSGSPPNATIVVGGVTRDGRDAVNDMSYILLKVTELMRLTDPNFHVRFKAGVNSDHFLKRACDVNYITCATPCIHSDDAMIVALGAKGWPVEDVREWTPIGCVEPGIYGKHCCSTSSLETNLVAPLEMALNNGVHPLNNWKLGPDSGSIENDDFPTFEDFWEAFETQCRFIFDQGVIGNNELGRIYQAHHPAPLMSALIDGCVSSGRGVTRGGAQYNSSGIALTGLADVTDSLMAIKKLVYDDPKVSFKTLKQAIQGNFQDHPELHAMILNRIPRFGSGDPEAAAMANRITRFINAYHREQKNYRGGNYSTGFWSMSYHTAYGRLTGALPSGRLAGEPFTPGLTPHPAASSNLLDNIMDVARLDPRTLDNNMAFNVRVVPGAADTHAQAVGRMAQYVKTYMKLGGMQMQFNVVDTAMLEDALAHPEYYPDLMVRVSGYCGYFTRLHPDLQREVIRRSEYRL